MYPNGLTTSTNSVSLGLAIFTLLSLLLISALLGGFGPLHGTVKMRNILCKTGGRGRQVSISGPRPCGDMRGRSEVFDWLDESGKVFRLEVRHFEGRE